jgi:hypothetical protein
MLRTPGEDGRALRARGSSSKLPLAALGLLALVACGPKSADGPRGPGRTGPIAADSDRFPHDLHTSNDPTIRGFLGRGLQCADCHPAEAVREGKVARPGSNQHFPCDVCHKDEFYKPPGAFCRNCHVSIDPTQKGANQLQPYPERGLKRVLAAVFSHKLHLDRGGMEGKVGFHVDCVDCHKREATSRDPQLPTHAACARCHAQKQAAQAKLVMDNCAGCHLQRNVDLKRGRVLYTDDLVFAHADHEVDAAGDQIECRTCHDQIPDSRSAEDVSVPAMQRCAICHEDATRTPERVRIANCGVCHKQITAGVAPRNHLTGGSVPENHTLAFRKDHGEAAAAKDARCAYCHTGLSGSPKDTCFECHQTWAPKDHNLGWRDDTHGREATVERDRCAVCHTSEFCTACHSIPPRSHQPLGQFRTGGHAEIARFDTRSCFACHTFESTCSQCHRSQR